jgi:uncharacterized tellurite resistance protein B-like protein
MSHDFLADRRKALEEAFFAKQDAKLVARLRVERERSLAIAALRGASSIEDPELLAKLVDLGIDARSWTALALVPLVEVAWADGRIEPKERNAIVAMAREHGVVAGSPGDELLETFLAQRPEPSVFASWGSYVTELAAHLDADERAAMRARLVERARKVARAAGGLLGIAPISEAEKRVIAALEKPFA